MAKTARTGTIDPTQIPNPSQIPPSGSQLIGTSHAAIEVYHGTLAGDTDAQPAAAELLGTAPDTGGLSNADYIYNQVSALFGGARLPSFRSPSGKNALAVVFVSGSSNGPYGAFHFDGTQTEFDHIVIDSLNISGGYSATSGLPRFSPQGTSTRQPHILSLYKGPDELFAVFHLGDSRLLMAKPQAVRDALSTASRNSLALTVALRHCNSSKVPSANSDSASLSLKHGVPLDQKLVFANQETVGLLSAIARIGAGRQYLSTALFAAEIVESFQKLTGKADPGKTDGEALSRAISFKLAPEIALVPGFNGLVTQQWWKDGSPDFVNVNSENDQSVDGNASGVMFLQFITDYLGVPFDKIIAHTPPAGGAPLGQTYQNLLTEYSEISKVAGANGRSAFQKMTSLLKLNSQNPDGTLNLPADGNPFPQMPGSKQGGLFATRTSNVSVLSQNAQKAINLQIQLDQELAAVKATLNQIQSDISTARAAQATVESRDEILAYGPPLTSTLAASLAQRVQSYRAPQFDQSLQQEFWPHVYNELPGTGPNTDRLQAITGTNLTPLAVEVTGTIIRTRLEPDGDLHVDFRPDDTNFPTNQGAGEVPIEVEIIYAGPVTQVDAKQAEKGFTNPFDITPLVPGTRILVAGPLIFDRAHGQPTPDGRNVKSGLEIHPVAGITLVSRAPGTQAPPSNQVSADIASGLGQLATLNQTLHSLSSILQEMEKQAQSG